MAPAGNHYNDKKLKWVEGVARLMDNQFKLPGTNFRFGLDPLIGLVPFLGDVSSFAVSGALVLTMAKHGASRNLVLRMLVNILLDFIIGSIPVVGAIFDFWFKANERNVRLLRSHYVEGKYQGKGTGFLIVVFAILLGAVCLVLYGLYSLIMWLYVQIAPAW